jgi:hypothetical protein
LSYVKGAAFDEIFQKKLPILGFVDPVSSFVYLKHYPDRSKECWEAFLRNLKVLGLNPDFAITDGALGMLGAITKIFPDALKIRDLFHVTQKLSKALKAFEGKCYGLIAAVDKLIKKNDSRDSNKIAELSSKMQKLLNCLISLKKRQKDFSAPVTSKIPMAMFHLQNSRLLWKRSYQLLSRQKKAA